MSALRALAVVIMLIAVVGVLLMGCGCVMIEPESIVDAVMLLAGAGMVVLAVVIFVISWAVWGDRFLKEII
jgi:hypothetical protein